PIAYPSSPTIKNMHLRSGKKYHPYLHGHSRKTVHLRHNRTYQRCSRDHHPNHHRRQNQRKARRCPWNSLPTELQGDIFRELLIDSDIPLSALTSIRLVCGTWNVIVSDLVRRDTKVQR